MINLYNYKGISLLKDNSPEYTKVKIYCLFKDIPNRIYKNDEFIDESFVPVGGSVEWIQKQLGYVVTPDYYPEWLSDSLYRKVWYSDTWDFYGKKIFIKPADCYKRFDGFITTDNYKEAPFWCSEIITFIDEFRYYITNGEIVESAWYQGREETIVPPELNIKIPNNFCGAVDFGLTNDGKCALIEAQHPFACGWYGDKIENYIQWCIDGWNYMKGEVLNEIQKDV